MDNPSTNLVKLTLHSFPRLDIGFFPSKHLLSTIILYSFFTFLSLPFPHLITHGNYLLCMTYRITTIPNSEWVGKHFPILAGSFLCPVCFLNKDHAGQKFINLTGSYLYFIGLQCLNPALHFNCSHKSIPSKIEMYSAASRGTAYPKAFISENLRCSKSVFFF